MKLRELTKEEFKIIEKQWKKNGKILDVSVKDDLGYLREKGFPKDL